MLKRQEPDTTAVRVALWRALHLEVDAAPPVFEDTIGLTLAATEEGWRQRPDMHPQGTRGYRASILGRARFVEDLVEEAAREGCGQYVVLGAGLDTFCQRRPELAPALRVFEIDRPGTIAWKENRLRHLGLPCPHFVPVDFEAGESWWEKLGAKGFGAGERAIVASAGVSIYLTREANQATLRQLATLAPGSMFVMTFLLPLELLDAAARPQHEMVYEKARAAGTPFLSFFHPEEIQEEARAAGFREVRHVSRRDLVGRYFASRSDGLEPASGEEFLIAST